MWNLVALQQLIRIADQLYFNVTHRLNTKALCVFLLLFIN